MKNDKLDLLLKLSGEELRAVMAQVKAEKEAGQRLPPVNNPLQSYGMFDRTPSRLITKA